MGWAIARPEGPRGTALLSLARVEKGLVTMVPVRVVGV
jgi:hypothetical protein